MASVIVLLKVLRKQSHALYKGEYLIQDNSIIIANVGSCILIIILTIVFCHQKFINKVHTELKG